MTTPKIFISYSHGDTKEIEPIKKFLRPLEREGLIDLWVDTRIEEGDDWKQAIDKALDQATVAVVILSANFFASDFIVDEELPRILVREKEAKLTLLPVFLSPSGVAQNKISFTDSSGTACETTLARFQGFGTPAKTLKDHDWSSRQKIYKKLAALLRQEASGSKTVLNDLSTLHESRPAVHTYETQPNEYKLTIHLNRHDQAFTVAYHLPGREGFGTHTRPWQKIADQIAPIIKVLEHDDHMQIQSAFQRSKPDRGNTLFNLLFGQETEWEPVMRTLFHVTEPKAPHPNPSRHPVRVSIYSNDTSLLGLPWRLTACNGRLLVNDDWEFVTNQMLDPEQDIEIITPCNVLFVTLQTAELEPAATTSHQAAFTHLIETLWPTSSDHMLRFARSRQELINALQGSQPRIIYIYGAGAVRHQQPCLLPAIEDPQGPINLVELSGLLKRYGKAPSLLVLNVTDLVGPNGTPSPSELLGDAVPLVIWHRLRFRDAETDTLALTWLRTWLTSGKDPISTLHKTVDPSLSSNPTAMTLTVHSNFRDWRTLIYPTETVSKKTPHLALDRRNPKAMVSSYLKDLARSGSKRVMALLAYAATGNRIQLLNQQLQNHLELDTTDITEINWHGLGFPDNRTQQLARDLEDELKLQLRADANEHVKHLLRRHAPKVVGAAKRGVLWLDWGIFGHGPDQQPPLTPTQLDAWIKFSSGYLARHCPQDLRIVSFLVLEIDNVKHNKLEEKLEQAERRPWCRNPSFMFIYLDPLQEIKKADLYNFLDDPNNSSCPPNIWDEIVERLMHETQGEFDATIALIEEAERGDWMDLLTKLQVKQGAVEVINDDDPF